MEKKDWIIGILVILLVAVLIMAAHRIGTLEDNDAQLKDKAVQECVENMKNIVMDKGSINIWWPGTVKDEATGQDLPATYSMTLVPYNNSIRVEVNDQSGNQAHETGQQ